MRHATGWLRVPDAPGFAAFWEARADPDSPPPIMWQKGPVRALVGREVWRDESVRWHISASCEDRVPTWEELVTAAHELRPGVPFCMGVPPRTWWMNVHPNVLHLWETRDAGLIEQWRDNARGHDPS